MSTNLNLLRNLGLFTNLRRAEQLNGSSKWHGHIGESKIGFEAKDLHADMAYCYKNSLRLPDQISANDKQEFFNSLDKLMALHKSQPGFAEQMSYDSTIKARGKRSFELLSYSDDVELFDRAFNFIGDQATKLGLKKELDTELLQIDPRVLWRVPSIIMTFIEGAIKGTTISMPSGAPDDVQNCFTKLKEMVVDSVRMLRIISEYLVARNIVTETDLKESLNAHITEDHRLTQLCRNLDDVDDEGSELNFDPSLTQYLDAYATSLASIRKANYSFDDIGDKLRAGEVHA